jgi:dTDP-4-amino-4,6-dideoxygalactose transaminase
MSTRAIETRVEVPFVDLAPAHDGLKAEILAGISDLIDANAYTNGPQVATFERAFADYCGTPDCVALASGMDALRLALIAGGLEREDEVIVPANTFIATVEAVTQAGGRPVVVDASERDYNLDPEAVEAAITPRTRFLLPVHLYGQLADMRALTEIAARHDLRILEDACQAHGAERDGLRAGAVGVAGAFSFYPAKNLGALGDGGALTTGDAALAAACRALREHGQAVKNRHDYDGYTARLDTLQAIVLLAKLPRLDGWNQQRRAAADFYFDALAGVGDLALPPVPEGSRPVWHLFPVRTGQRERLAAFLKERGVATGRHYPTPVHLAPAFAYLGYRPGDFPVAERVSEEHLTLPMFAGISELQLETVVEAIREFFERG